MLCRRTVASVAVAAALCATIVGARTQGQPTYPDWPGQWLRVGGEQFDPSRPEGKGQEAPLTAEYQAIFETVLARQAASAALGNPPPDCASPGMPRMMIGYQPMEIVITPDVTYLISEYIDPLRRIFTDGRAFPQRKEPTFAGVSIGHWEDTDGDGRYDTLVVETRGTQGPRQFDSSGLPLHSDNETVVRERIALDKSDRNILRDEITTIDHALTKPWTVTRTYRREANPTWIEYNCGEDSKTVVVRGETYLVSEDGRLMPARKDQPPPDLKYFSQPGQ